jgi:hypothetical protein
LGAVDRLSEACRCLVGERSVASWRSRRVRRTFPGLDWKSALCGNKLQLGCGWRRHLREAWLRNELPPLHLWQGRGKPRASDGRLLLQAQCRCLSPNKLVQEKRRGHKRETLATVLFTKPLNRGGSHRTCVLPFVLSPISTACHSAAQSPLYLSSSISHPHPACLPACLTSLPPSLPPSRKRFVFHAHHISPPNHYNVLFP